jgi:F-type H+-transporting ATPase subunit epsilon
MPMTLHCDIVSAETKIFSGLVQMIVAAGSEGDLGVFYGHAPLLTGLKPGPVRLITQDGDEEVYYVSGGYLEVQPYHVTILADSVLRAGDMDEAAALEAKAAAEQELANQTGDFDYSSATAHLAEVVAQLRTLQAIRKKMGK